MSTPYGDLISPAQSWSNRHGVSWTRHALERWDLRTPPSSVSPERAWVDGVPVPKWLHIHFTDARGNKPDEVRIYYEADASGDYLVGLVSRSRVIRTVLDVRQMGPLVQGALEVLKEEVPPAPRGAEARPIRRQPLGHCDCGESMLMVDGGTDWLCPNGCPDGGDR